MDRSPALIAPKARLFHNRRTDERSVHSLHKMLCDIGETLIHRLIKAHPRLTRLAVPKLALGSVLTKINQCATSLCDPWLREYTTMKRMQERVA